MSPRTHGKNLVSATIALTLGYEFNGTQAGEALAALGRADVLPLLEEYANDSCVEVSETCAIGARRVRWCSSEEGKEELASLPPRYELGASRSVAECFCRLYIEDPDGRPPTRTHVQPIPLCGPGASLRGYVLGEAIAIDDGNTSRPLRPVSRHVCSEE